MRVVALAECATRALVAASIGAYSTAEKTLTSQRFGHLGPGVVVRADRNFSGYELWRDAAATGAGLLWRASSSFHLEIDEVLSDGSLLFELKALRQLSRAGVKEITVRVIEYRLADGDSDATDTFTLITTLLDPGSAPGVELAELYHGRWQIDTAFGAFESDLKGDSVVLRSKAPDGADQECWALLCAYHAIRELICAAAALAERDPLRISFINALDAVRAPNADPGSFPPHHNTDDVLAAFLKVIASATNPERPGRSNPRHAKRTLRYPSNAAEPAKLLRPRASLTLVTLPRTSKVSTQVKGSAVTPGRPSAEG
jgi:hypothetical protein